MSLSLFRIPPLFRSVFAAALAIGMAAAALPQQSDTGSSSSQPSQYAPQSSVSAPRIAQPEVGGSAVTLEDSEPLFYLAVALNTCGYDAGLADSSPVRQKIRDEVNTALAASETTRNHRDALCGYIREHTLADPGLNLAQYISLALYLSPPPELTPTVDELELPPDSTQVVNILPLLRNFADDIHMNALWVEHRPDYEALLKQVHDPMEKMVLGTNIYLHLPVSSYDGRRFLVLLEPMLDPSATNARIYGVDYIIVLSPSAQPASTSASASASTSADAVPVRMDDIRHTYLHYLVEPLVYSKTSAMQLLQPLLKSVADAPLDFLYKSDVVALVNECLIKAIEIHMTDPGLPRPQRPSQIRQRSESERYEIEMNEYERQAEAIRRKNVDLAVRQGWVLVDYFYGQVGQTVLKDGVSLKDAIGAMVYGMDVGRETHIAQQVQFLSTGTHDVVSHAPRPRPALSAMDQAEMKLLKGDLDGAEAVARAALADPAGDHARAYFLLARVALMQSNLDEALTDFQQALKTSKDPRTLAWSHIYLGRLYDDQSGGRDKALEQYRAALEVRDGRPDTKAAAEQGLKQPFVTPKTDDDEPLDPSGKAQKEAYRPPPQP